MQRASLKLNLTLVMVPLKPLLFLSFRSEGGHTVTGARSCRTGFLAMNKFVLFFSFFNKGFVPLIFFFFFIRFSKPGELNCIYSFIFLRWKLLKIRRLMRSQVRAVQNITKSNDRH